MNWYQKNKEKVLARASIYYNENKEKIKQRVRDRHISKYFPELSVKEALAQHKNLIKAQNNLCAICARPEVKKDKPTGKVCSLSIDHCHKTGKVRGLLCFDCNTTLGKIERNLNQVLNYLGVK